MKLNLFCNSKLVKDLKYNIQYPFRHPFGSIGFQNIYIKYNGYKYGFQIRHPFGHPF